jgi:hypothetical protein
MRLRKPGMIGLGRLGVVLLVLALLHPVASGGPHSHDGHGSPAADASTCAVCVAGTTPALHRLASISLPPAAVVRRPEVPRSRGRAALAHSLDDGLPRGPPSRTD